MFAAVFAFYVMTSATASYANISTTVGPSVLPTLNVSTDNVTFNIVPMEIVKNVTTEIDMQCSFSRVQNPSMASVLSILISQANESSQPAFSYIASVNEIEAVPHNISNDVIKLAGTIDNHGDSFLKATVRISSSNMPALFRCEVNGFDAMGKPVTLSNTTKLRVVQNDVSLLSEELKALKAQIQQHQNDIEAIQNKLNSTNCTSPGLNNDTMEQRLILMRQSMFYTSELYNGHRYYLVKVLEHFIYTEAQATCELHGGYLLELDDHDEFRFVADFLQHHNYYQYVWTGATDSGHEGVWLNPHNVSSRPLFDWALGYPHNNNMQNCQCCRLFSYTWQVIDCLCNFRSINIGEDSYICEIPE